MRLLLTPCHVMNGLTCPFCVSSVHVDSAIGYAFRQWLLCLPGPTDSLAYIISEATGISDAHCSVIAAALFYWAANQGIVCGMLNMAMPGINHQLPALRLSPQEEARIWLTRHTRTR